MVWLGRVGGLVVLLCSFKSFVREKVKLENQVGYFFDSAGGGHCEKKGKAPRGSHEKLETI